MNIPLTMALVLIPYIIASISNFFNNLEGDVVAFALAASTFFFAWAAILYMTSGENQRRIDYAKMSLYAALTGLALALLAGTIAGPKVNNGMHHTYRITSHTDITNKYKERRLLHASNIQSSDPYESAR